MGDRIDAILARVLQPIPAPYRAAPTPRATWAKLKVGDQLSLRVSWNFASLGTLPQGTQGVVTLTDSEGMTLSLEGRSLRWTNPEWPLIFSKLPKARKRKAPK